VPVWAWAAAAALLVVTLGGAFFATRGGGDDKPGKVAQVTPAKETLKELPSTAKSPPRETAEKQPPNDPARPDPDKPPAGTQPPNPPGPAIETRPPNPPAPRLAGRPEGALAYAWSAPGGLLAGTPTGTNSWILIDVAAARQVREFGGHRGPVTCLALTPDGRRALSGSADRTLRWWDVETGQTLQTLEGHDRGVVAVAVSADGKRGLSADLGPRVRLWDLETGKEVHHFDHLNGVGCVAFSPDGKNVVAGIGQVASGNAYTIHRWDAGSGAAEGTLPGHPQPVLCLAFSPDGTRLASGSAEGRALVWQLPRGGIVSSLGGPGGPVHQVAFSPNANVLEVAAGVRAHFWTLSTLRCVTRMEPAAEAVAAFFQPDGSVRWVWRKGNQFSWAVVPKPEQSAAVVTTTPPPRPTPAPPPRPPRPSRQAVPDREALAAGKKEVEQILQTRTDNQPRAYQLFNVGVGLRNPGACYAALKEARELFIENGNILMALQAGDQIVQRFLVGRREMRVETVTQTAKTANAPFQHEDIARNALRLAGEAQADDDFDLASRLVAVARVAAPKAGNRSAALVAAADRAGEELAAAKPDLPAYKEALARLTKDPGDADANPKVGRFRCIHQDAWDEGLPLLAKGGNDALKALAAKDLAEPAEANARKEVGDGWWAAAATAKPRSAARQAFLRRAYHWYKPALPQLTTGQAEIKQRLNFVTKQLPDVLDPWGHLDVSEAKVEGDYLRLEKTKCLFTRRFFKGGVDITVEARTEKNNIRLTAGDGGVVIFNWEVGQGGIRVQRPDFPAADGKGWGGGNLVGTNPRNLDPDKWYTLRWRLTPTGQKVWVDDELVFEVEEPYDLSVPRQVGVSAFFQNAIEVKSVVVKSLSAGEAPKQ
jgi:WD40 repeat protein